MENGQNIDLGEDNLVSGEENTQKLSLGVQENGTKKEMWQPGDFVKDLKITGEENDTKELSRFPITIIISLIIAIFTMGLVSTKMIEESRCKCTGDATCWCGTEVTVSVFIALIPMTIGTILAIVGMMKLKRSREKLVSILQTMCYLVALLQIPILFIIYLIYNLLLNPYS